LKFAEDFSKPIAAQLVREKNVPSHSTCEWLCLFAIFILVLPLSMPGYFVRESLKVGDACAFVLNLLGFFCNMNAIFTVDLM